MRCCILLGVLVISSAACGRIAFDELGIADGALAITPPSARTNLSSLITFTASGGEPPYVFSLASGDGELDAASGMFRAPAYPGIATVEVSDMAGDVAAAEISFGGDYLYAAGGFINDVAQDEVWRTSDGVDWEVIGRLPQPRGDGSFFVMNDRLFYLGGGDSPDGTLFDHAWSSLDGSTWTEIGQLPEAVAVSAEGVHRGRIWLVGGTISGDSYTNKVWSSADGASWQDEAPIPSGLHGGELAIYDDGILLVAGHELSGFTASIWKRLADSSWVQHGSVPVAGEYHGVTVVAGELCVTGGTGLRDRVVSSADGTTWSDHARLPIAREHHEVMEWQDALWIVGGIPAHTWRSAGGEPWVMTGTFPTQMSGGRLVQFTPR